MSLILGARSPRFFFLWISIELNTFIFIFILTTNFLSKSSTVSIKYFLVQSFRSALFLGRLIILLLGQQNTSILFLIINFRIFFKLGIFPLHFWIISFCNSISWDTIFLLLTAQKVIPLLVLKLFNLGNPVIFIVLIGVAFRAIISFAVISIQKLIVYSSIYSLRWILPIITSNFTLRIIYFISYVLFQFILFKLFSSYQVFFTQQLFKKNFSLLGITRLLLTLWSLGGLPPTWGFFLKVSIAREIILTGVSIGFILILLLASLLVLKFYLSFCLTFLHWFKFSFFFNRLKPFNLMFFASALFFMPPRILFLNFLIFLLVLKTKTWN